MNLNKLFNRRNEPSPKKVEKAGEKNLGIQQEAESGVREGLVNELGLNQDDLKKINEIGVIRMDKSKDGSDKFSFRYLGHDFTVCQDEVGQFIELDGKKQYPNNLMKGSEKDRKEGEKWFDFMDKIKVYSKFLNQQVDIPEIAKKKLTHKYAYMGHPEILTKMKSAEDRAITGKTIDDFLGRSS